LSAFVEVIVFELPEQFSNPYQGLRSTGLTLNTFN
jgi:hypothetical protein